MILCPYLISLIMDGMKMVESNAYKSFPDDITELLIFDNEIVMIQKILLRTMAVILRVIVKKMKVGTRSKNVFLICAVNVLVHEKMISFCKQF